MWTEDLDCQLKIHYLEKRVKDLETELEKRVKHLEIEIVKINAILRVFGLAISLKNEDLEDER